MLKEPFFYRFSRSFRRYRDFLGLACVISATISITGFFFSFNEFFFISFFTFFVAAILLLTRKRGNSRNDFNSLGFQDFDHFSIPKSDQDDPNSASNLNNPANYHYRSMRNY